MEVEVMACGRQLLTGTRILCLPINLTTDTALIDSLAPTVDIGTGTVQVGSLIISGTNAIINGTGELHLGDDDKNNTSTGALELTNTNSTINSTIKLQSDRKVMLYSDGTTDTTFAGDFHFIGAAGNDHIYFNSSSNLSFDGRLYLNFAAAEDFIIDGSAGVVGTLNINNNNAGNFTNVNSFTIKRGQVNIGASAGLGTLAITLEHKGDVNSPSQVLGSAGGVVLSNALTIEDTGSMTDTNEFIYVGGSNTSGTVTLSGAITVNLDHAGTTNPTRFNASPGGIADFTGVVSNTGSKDIEIYGGGTVVLSNTGNNLGSNNLIVRQGTLQVNDTGAVGTLGDFNVGVATGTDDVSLVTGASGVTISDAINIVNQTTGTTSLGGLILLERQRSVQLLP